MEKTRLRRLSWLIMMAAACLTAVTIFLPIPFERYLLWFFGLLLFSGMYSHLRSKQYQPFMQWQFYLFTVFFFEAFFLYDAPILAGIASLAAMLYFALLPEADKSRSIDFEDREKVVAAVLGGCIGLIAGFYVSSEVRKGMESFGDRFGAGCGLLSVFFVPGIVGAVVGRWIVSIPLTIRDKDSWKVKTAVSAIVLVLLSMFSFSLLQGDIGLSFKIRNQQAAYELKNAATNLEGYFADNRKYPDTWEVSGTPERPPNPNVRFEYSRIPGKADGYMLRAYHIKGTSLCMKKSDSDQILCRDKSEPDDRFAPM